MTPSIASLRPRFCHVLLVSIVALTTLPIAGAAENVQAQNLIVGIGNSGRVGSWIPVRIKANGLKPESTARLTVTASDAKGDDCINVAASGVVNSSGEIGLEGVFQPGRLDGTVVVQLVDDANTTLWTHTIAVTEEAPTADESASAEINGSNLPLKLQVVRHSPLTVMTVGQTPGLTELVPIYEARDTTRGTLSHFVATSFDSLPNSRRGYDSIDIIVLNSEYDLNVTQAEAIQNWVMAGGHLIVSGGDSLPKLLSSSAGPWIKSLFGLQEQLVRSQDLSALQNFVIGANQLQTNRKDVSIIQVSSKQPDAVVDSINGPLISRNTAGAGQVTLISVDLNQDPVKNWLSLPQLYEMLLFGRLSADTEEQFGHQQMISSTGVTDLATQLAVVSDAIPPEERWTSWQAMLLMVVLLAMVGPLDYLVAVKLLNRPRMTWFTFPAIVTLACGFTWWNSFSGRPPEVVRAVHLLDVGQSGSRQTVRTRSWSSLSTTDSRFAKVSKNNLSVRDGLKLAKVDDSFTWHGRAEDVYGGLYRPGGAGLGKVSSRRTDGEVPGYESLPLLADGSQSFVAESMGDANDQSVFESQLKMGPGGLLEGSFVHHLNVPIRNWVIAYGSRIYRPSTKSDESELEIKPGTTWNRESGKVRISEIRDFLKGIRAVENTGPKKAAESNMTQVQTPYDASSSDPQDILTMVSLYQIAGGEAYVKLSNDALRRDELSDSIPLNMAMLIGVVDLPLTELVVDDQIVPAAKSQTVVRLMMPVDRTSE